MLETNQSKPLLLSQSVVGACAETVRDEPRRVSKFAFGNEAELTLLTRLVAKILNEPEPSVSVEPPTGKQASSAAFELTDKEARLVGLLYAQYRRALAQQIQLTIEAFMLKNEIGFAARSNQELDWQTIRLAFAIEKTEIVLHLDERHHAGDY